ncbi:MAG: cell division protein FtsQ/DivIB [Eubacteriaceae bacterium]
MSLINLRKKNKKQRHYKKKYVTLVVVMFLLVVITIYFLTLTDFFNIEEIQVIDNNRITNDEIILKSGLNSTDNIFMFNKKEVLQSIEKIPYIQEASLIRIFPDKVKIYIKERQALCIFYYQNKYVYIDSDEIILEYIDDLNEINIPIITLTSDSVGTIIIGNKIQFEPDYVKNNLFQILITFYDNDLLKYLSEINITDENLLYVYTKGGSIIKIKDSDSVIEKLEFLITYLQEKDERMIIDLTHDGNPTYIPR